MHEAWKAGTGNSQSNCLSWLAEKKQALDSARGPVSIHKTEKNWRNPVLTSVSHAHICMCTCTCMNCMNVRIHTYIHVLAHHTYNTDKSKWETKIFSFYSQNTWHCFYFASGLPMNYTSHKYLQKKNEESYEWWRQLIFQVIFGRPSGIHWMECSPPQINHLISCFFPLANINMGTHFLYLTDNTDLTYESNNIEQTNWIDLWLSNWSILFFSFTHICIYYILPYTYS